MSKIIYNPQVQVSNNDRDWNIIIALGDVVGGIGESCSESCCEIVVIK